MNARFKRRLAIPLAAIAALGAVVTAVAVVGASHAGPNVVRDGPGRSQELLSADLAQLTTDAFRSVALGAPSQDNVGPQAPDVPDSWLYVQAHAASRQAAVEILWQGSLLVSAYADQATAAALPRLSGATVSVSDSAGRVLAEDSWYVPDAAQTPTAKIGDPVAAAATASTTFAQGAMTDGDAFVALRFVHLPTLSPVLTIRVADTVGFIKNRGQRISRVLGPTERGWDARFLRVESAAGTVIYEAASTPRLGSSEEWASPDVGVPVGH